MESRRRELTAGELDLVNGGVFLELLKELADFILKEILGHKE